MCFGILTNDLIVFVHGPGIPICSGLSKEDGVWRHINEATKESLFKNLCPRGSIQEGPCSREKASLSSCHQKAGSFVKLANFRLLLNKYNVVNIISHSGSVLDIFWKQTSSTIISMCQSLVQLHSYSFTASPASAASNSFSHMSIITMYLCTYVN